MGFFASSGILNRRGFFSAPVSAAPPAPSGIPVSTTLVNVDYGNQNTGLFGTNKTVDSSIYIPEQVWYQQGQGGTKEYFLDFNFNISGLWSFLLFNSGAGVNGYQWKNNSNDATTIPTSGWFGTSENGFVAGTTTLVLTAA